jgi:anti-anti-sigma regulatory factor
MFWADRFDDGRILLLTLEGRLSRNDLIDLSDRLRGLAAQGMFQVVVDVRDVDHWDFRGLQVLAEAVEFRRRHGAATAFITPSTYLKDIAKAAGVFERLDFYDALRLNGGVELSVIDVTVATEEEALREAGGS